MLTLKRVWLLFPLFHFCHLIAPVLLFWKWLYGEKGKKKLHRRINMHRVVHSPVLQIIPYSFYYFPLVIASIMLFKFSCKASDALHSYNYCQRKTKVTVSRYQTAGVWGLEALLSFSHYFLVQFLTLCYNGACLVFTGKFRQIIDRAV